MRGATRIQRRQPLDRDISIHAPLAGCDADWAAVALSDAISIHAPLAGCDHCDDVLPDGEPKFQSTHPLRGATVVQISPTYVRTAISIHAPLAGCDARCARADRPTDRFQSTHPLRGATHLSALIRSAYWISIHAPLAGCDTWRLWPDGCAAPFQSTHPLRGATVGDVLSLRPDQIFQSTHPLRGATVIFNTYLLMIRFQSTHPLRGATAKMHKIFCAFCDNRQFYRVSPSGVPSVGALFTYSRGLQRARAGANLPVNGCALGLRAKASAGARLPSELRERSLFKSRRSLLAPVRAAVPFQCNSRQQRTESCPNFSA